MRILILSFYFEPDLSAGSFRASALLRALSLAAPDGTTIDLLTTQPNRYETFKLQAPSYEKQGDIIIQRFSLPAHRSGFIDQAYAFLVYAWNTLMAIRGKNYDLVVATSGRLLTATLASLIARQKKASLYLDIRDIFVDTISDLMAKPLSVFLLPLFKQIERFSISRATKINLVSGGFLDYFIQRYPKKLFSIIPNGVDDEFLNVDFSKTTAERKVILYAGNLGKGQGLDRILPGLAIALMKSHDFVIIGDGGQKTALSEAVVGITNVTLLPPVSRKKLIEYYRNSDILFLHLNSHSAFQKVLPSKLFEYAASGKPILAGVSGYSAEFLRTVPNVAVFPPCDVATGVDAVRSLKSELTDRAFFINSYRRSTLTKTLADDILTFGSIS